MDCAGSGKVAEVYPAAALDQWKLDAMIAVLVSRAVAVGLTDPAPVEHLARVRREGWIRSARATSDCCRREIR